MCSVSGSSSSSSGSSGSSGSRGRSNRSGSDGGNGSDIISHQTSSSGSSRGGGRSSGGGGSSGGSSSSASKGFSSLVYLTYLLISYLLCILLIYFNRECLLPCLMHPPPLKIIMPLYRICLNKLILVTSVHPCLLPHELERTLYTLVLQYVWYGTYCGTYGTVVHKILYCGIYGMIYDARWCKSIDDEVCTSVTIAI